MNPRSVTFAQAIAKKTQVQQNHIQTIPTLAQLFQQWTYYPQEQYTIRVDTQAGCRSRDALLRVGNSYRASERQNMLDSWIQKQSAAENKENLNRQSGRVLINNRLPKRSNNSSKESSMYVQRSNRSNEPKQIYNAEYLVHNVSESQSEKQLIKHPFVPKSHNQKSVKQNQTSADLLAVCVPHAIDSIRMNSLIASTENIHNEIAALAKQMAQQHQYKLDTQQSDEELIEEQEKKLVKVVEIKETEEEREKRRWLEAKQVVGSYLKNFNKSRIPTIDKYADEPTVKIFAPSATVAYSFASNIEDTKKYQILTEQPSFPTYKPTQQLSAQSIAQQPLTQLLIVPHCKQNQLIHQTKKKVQFKPSNSIEMTTSIETVVTKKGNYNQMQPELPAIKGQMVTKQQIGANKGEEIETIIMRKWQSPPCSTPNDSQVPKVEVKEFNPPSIILPNQERPCSPFKTIKQVKNSITNPLLKVQFAKSQDTASINSHSRPLRFIKTYASPKTFDSTPSTTKTYTSTFSNHQLSKIEYIPASNSVNHKKNLQNIQKKQEKHTYHSTLTKPIPTEPKQPFSTVPLIASKTMHQSPQNSFESSERFQFDF